MSLSKLSAEIPDFDGMVHQFLTRWRQLPLEARDNRDVLDEILDDCSFPLDANNRDILETRLNAALAEEGYKGAPFEVLNATRKIITRCLREGFISI